MPNMTLPSVRTPTPLRALSDVLLRSQSSVYHQHRPGLRRQVRLGSLLKKCPRLRDGSRIGGYIEDPVRFHVKIAIAGPGIYMHELPPLFHIESHRLEGRVEHAGVGGE